MPALEDVGTVDTLNSWAFRGDPLSLVRGSFCAEQGIPPQEPPSLLLAVVVTRDIEQHTLSGDRQALIQGKKYIPKAFSELASIY